MQYPIPKRSSGALSSLQPNQARNPGLIFERFAPDWGSYPKSEQPQIKEDGLIQVINNSLKVDKAIVDACLKRWKALTKQAHAQPFEMKTDWRFIPGLGRKGPLEVGFTFHRLGFPMLPGSSVKGIARAGARLTLDLRLDPEDRDAKDPSKDFATQYPQYAQKESDYLKDFFSIFGEAPQPGDEDSAQAGGAIFFDALPARPPKLELDIMNPHFQKYYSDKANKEYPVDSDSPNPIKFLVVAPQQEFCFAVGWRSTQDKPELRQKAEEWLKLGLQDLGAGAKTSAGYGYFELTPQPSSVFNQELTSTVAPTLAPMFPNTPPKGANWKKAKISGDSKFVYEPNNPDTRYRLQREQVLPKGYTPAAKADVEFVVETLADGSQRVWVKRLYHPVE